MIQIARQARARVNCPASTSPRRMKFHRRICRYFTNDSDLIRRSRNQTGPRCCRSGNEYAEATMTEMLTDRHQERLAGGDRSPSYHNGSQGRHGDALAAGLEGCGGVVPSGRLCGHDRY